MSSRQDHRHVIVAGRRWNAEDFNVADCKEPGLGVNPAKLLSRKRAQRTYSVKASKRPKTREGHSEDGSRGGRPSTRQYATAPEPDMHLATPIVRRIQGHWSSPFVPEPVASEFRVPAKPGRCHHSHEDCAKRCFFEDSLAEHRSTTDPSVFPLYESIFRAFDALLRATAAAEAQVARPKSLMAMCLRKVPDYLAELESWRLQELEEQGTSSVLDDANPSFGVYSDLESLGMGECGWKNLATVVQSHGIRIVKDAILERLISDRFALVLSELCSELKPVSDRWQLLEAMVTQQHRGPCSPDDHLSSAAWSRTTSVLECLAPPLYPEDETEARMFKAKLTTDLLSTRLLPQEWISCNVFSNIWSLAMTYLTSRTAYYHAIPFFTASIQLYCNQAQQSPPARLTNCDSVPTAQQSLISSLATLCTLVLLGQETMETESAFTCRYHTSILCKRAEYILRACLASTSNSHGRPSRQASTYALLLTVFFVSEGTTTTATGVPVSREAQTLANFWARVGNNASQHAYRQYYEATMALMASIARGCTRKDSGTPAHTYLVKLCDKLDTACPEVKALRTIRVDTAFHLADLTGDLWDLNFAEQLATTTQAAGNTTQTPSRKPAAFSGFRWDEGISEWVTVTPEVARRKQPVRGRVTRDRSCVSPEVPAPTKEGTSQEHGSPLPAPGRVVGTDVGDVSNLTGKSRLCRVRTSAEADTTCQPKRPRKQHDTQPTHDKAGVPAERLRRHSTAIPEQLAYCGSGTDSAADEDLDELQFDEEDQENHLPARKPARSLRRRRSRRSLLSLRPVRNIPNDYYDDESSGDELGVL